MRVRSNVESLNCNVANEIYEKILNKILSHSSVRIWVWGEVQLKSDIQIMDMIMEYLIKEFEISNSDKRQ